MDIIKNVEIIILEANEELNNDNWDEQIDKVKNKKECEKEIFDFFIEYQYEDIDDIEEEMTKIEDEIRIEKNNLK